MKPEEIRDDRQMRSLTGLSLKQFAELTIEFEKDYQEDQQQRYTRLIQWHTSASFRRWQKRQIAQISRQIVFHAGVLQNLPNI